MRGTVILALLLAGCLPIGGNPDGGGGGFGGAGGFGGFGGGAGGGGGTTTTPAKPPVIDLTWLGAGASKLLVDAANLRLDIDPTVRDPITALGECADLVAYCYAPPTFSVGTCLSRARTCTTATPWTEDACCPADCKTAFLAQVSAGLSERDALEKVLFREPDCFPGVRAALEGQ